MSPSDADPYTVLEIPSAASMEDIRSAFRRLAKRYHPDAGGTHDQMLKLLAAWQVLSDRDRRAAYDRSRANPNDQAATKQWNAVREEVEREAQRYPSKPDRVAEWIEELLRKAVEKEQNINEVARLRRYRDEEAAAARDEAERRRRLENPGDTSEELIACMSRYIHRIPLEEPHTPIGGELIQICEAALFKLRALAATNPSIVTTVDAFESQLKRNVALAHRRELIALAGLIGMLVGVAVFVVFLIRAC
jgi:curved DNA-binding protein CbpA